MYRELGVYMQSPIYLRDMRIAITGSLVLALFIGVVVALGVLGVIALD